ncbi:response regulator receiver and ANTAR domain protein [Geothermobacter ehrlichii]|uniref:Response regulator receiver and ANTAR domain protein n=1 Tax=Geothermobacter ehrlichii TaxID=213224 RepID=A0A5D3WIK2_9BACT|nr:response regulator [Geothermobacter ehrlichii]TYO97707.1 response regulator receiver and ANTAR domain protein [Geothermobacter ehrlichii]
MKVLLVADDEPLVRHQVLESVASYGFDRIIEAENGVQALSLALTEKPLLAILDVSMPGMDGVSVAEKLSKERPMPLLLLTATRDAETFARAREAGVQHYLLKPFDPDQLRVTLELAIHQFMELHQLREENDRLKETLETRKQIDRAKRVLMGRGLSEPEAYRRMQKLAMDRRKSLRQVAEAILLVEG